MEKLFHKISLIGLLSSIIVLILYTIAQVTGIYDLVSFAAPYLFRDDKVTYYEERLAPVKPFLTDHGQVGYLSDSEKELEEFLLTQYVLAPTIVVKNTTCCRLVVGNFFDSGYLEHTTERHLRPIHTFPDNVVLFEYVKD